MTLPVPPEILDKLLADERKKVLEFFAGSFQYAGPVPNPVMAKLNAQHIADMIALASKDADYHF